jgi:hypothetical protein
MLAGHQFKVFLIPNLYPVISGDRRYMKCGAADDNKDTKV